MTELHCFYSLSSPWAYFGGPKLQDIVRRHRVKLVLKPYDFQEVVPRTAFRSMSSSRTSIAKNTKTGVIRVAVTTSSPELSVGVAARLLELVNASAEIF